MSTEAEKLPTSAKHLTKAERIQQLNEIDKVSGLGDILQ